MFLTFGWIGVLAILFGIGFYAVRAARSPLREGEALFFAWTLCYIGFVLAITPWDMRYLFYLAPAVTVLLFSAVEEIASATGVRRVWPALCAAAIGISSLVSWQQPDRLEGFYEAARTVTGMRPARVLICSERNGAFITGLRTLQDHPESIVIRGDAFPREFFQQEKFTAFLHEYGIDAVVIDDTLAADAWEAVRHARIAPLQLRQTIPIAAQNVPGGEILVYAHTNPSPNPASAIRLRSTMVGGGLNLELE